MASSFKCDNEQPGLTLPDGEFDLIIRAKRRDGRSGCRIDDIPADKSISQRALLLNALATGGAVVSNVLKSDDVTSCLQALQLLGVRTEWRGERELYVEGAGLDGLKETPVLDLGNTATSTRIVMAILAGYPYRIELRGNERLSSRTMAWTIDKLEAMGASIRCKEGSGRLPLVVEGRRPLRAADIAATVASAQEKTVVLLAGLFAEGTTRYAQLCQSRDHTERLLRYMGVPVRSGPVTEIDGLQPFAARDITVPGDISSAAFMATAALLRADGPVVTLPGIGLNPTRLGFVRAAAAMGAAIAVIEAPTDGPEPFGTIEIRPGAELRATEVTGMAFVQSLIDEVPLLALLATAAEGTTVFTDCVELKDKDTNRLATVTAMLRGFGADIACNDDTLVVRGRRGNRLRAADVDSFGDHRIAMTAAVAASCIADRSRIRRCRCIGISYPGFVEHLSEFAEIEIVGHDE